MQDHSYIFKENLAPKYPSFKYSDRKCPTPSFLKPPTKIEKEKKTERKPLSFIYKRDPNIQNKPKLKLPKEKPSPISTISVKALTTNTTPKNPMDKVKALEIKQALVTIKDLTRKN
jgi:hypothetical protein